MPLITLKSGFSERNFINFGILKIKWNKSNTIWWNMMICMKIYENQRLKFRNLGQNDQNTPDNKTMALKPGFFEINFAKLKNMKCKWD